MTWERRRAWLTAVVNVITLVLWAGVIAWYAVQPRNDRPGWNAGVFKGRGR